MDRVILEDILAATERHLAEAECQVANQRERVAQLERDGLDTAEPTRLLIELEELQAIHVAERDRLRKKLGPSRRPTTRRVILTLKTPFLKRH
jgi:hypothetical protein